MVMGLSGVAHAVDTTPTLTTKDISSTAIQAAPASPTAIVDTDAFVLEQAQAGRSVDASAVTTASISGLTLVYEAGQTVSNVTVDTVTDPGDSETSGEAYGVTASDPEDIVDLPTVPTPPCKDPATCPTPPFDPAAPAFTNGVGLAASVNGATQQAGKCNTLKGSRGNLTSCWARYKVSDSNKKADYYFYDRWATANGKALTGPDNIAVKIDLRSQAYANITGIADYAPRTAIKTCTQAGSVGLSYGALSVDMPLSECEEVTPYPDTTLKKMRTVYDQGAIFSGRTHGLEMGVVYITAAGKVSSANHYSYARFCRVTYASCGKLDETPRG
jgi:hypothetical protein